MSAVLLLITQYSVYMASLALVAWHTERRTGRDAFALVPALAVGLAVSGLLSSSTPWAALVVIGPFCAAVCFSLLEWLFRRLSLSLLEVLVFVVAVLAAFDWATEHAPLALGGDARSLATLAIVLAWLPWLRELADKKSLAALSTRLGVGGAWALRFWGHGSHLRNANAVPAVILLSFVPAVLLPLTTTGVLSGTILKDAVLAMLFARVCSSRPPTVLAALAITAACLRLAVGFGVATNLGPPAVEAGLYLGGLFWLRTHGFRVGVGAIHDR